MISSSHRRIFLALLLAAAGAAGCSGAADNLPREAVAGNVTLDGQPLAAGMISFTPADNAVGMGGGASIERGRFSIARDVGLVPGKYRVSINSSSGGGAQERPKSPEGRGKERSAKPSETIPAKYNSQTELTVDIKKGGSNDSLQFTLTSK